MSLTFSQTQGNGVTLSYPIVAESGFFEDEDIVVELIDVEDGSIVEQVQDTDYTISNNNVIFTVAPTSDYYVRIRRVANNESTYSDFTRGNAFGATNLNNSFLHALYQIQQLADGFRPDDFYWKGNTNAGKNKLTNLAEGTEEDDSVTFGQVSSLTDEANLAAEEAQASADEASDSASAASSSAASALSSSNNAADSALAASTSAGNASDSELAAASSASEAEAYAASINPDTLRIGINVKSYGAVGDGITDDTTSIQNAINASSGGIVFFPAGDYKISSTLTINTSGVHLVGEGKDNGRVAWSEWPTHLVWNGIDDGSYMFSLDSGLTEILRGITFNGLVMTGSSKYDKCILANVNTSNCRVRNCIIRQWNTGITLSLGCTGWLFEDVEVFSMYDYGFNLLGNNHHTTFNSIVASTTDSSLSGTAVVSIGTTSHCSNVNFFGCDLEHKGLQYQIMANNVRALLISGCYMELSDLSDSVGYISLGSTVYSTAAEGVTIQGGYFTGNNYIDTAIRIFNAGNVNITGNYFRAILSSVINSNGYCPDSRYYSNHLDGVSQVFNDAESADGFCLYDFVSVKIFDDNVATFTIPDEYCIFEVYLRRSGAYYMKCMIDVEGTVNVTEIDNTSATWLKSTTGILTGTTGADATITVSAYDGKIYIENRFGAAYEFACRLNARTSNDT